MTSSNQKMNDFTVLIAGGSLVGLGLALSFERAGINYELFEKGEFAPQLGASIGLHPHTIRILEQLGAWSDIEGQVVPLQGRNHYDEKGDCFEKSHVLRHIQRVLRRPIIFMERCKALEALHSHVIDKSKLHSNSAVVFYEESDEEVTVTLNNGTKHRGNLLIGADGVHSKVRDLMADKINQTDESLAKDIREAFSSEYNCIFAVSRNGSEKQFLPDAVVHNVYYPGYSAVSAAGVHGLVFWFLFMKASELTKLPKCPRFTDEDAEECIRKYGSSLVGPGYTIQDLWDNRVKASMVPLEEGVVKQWFHNRVVLIGDAVHKATVNPGLGGNLAYEGIARLTNGLVSLLKESPRPSIEELNTVFDTYVAGQKPRAETVVDLSGQITRYEAQDTYILKFAAKHIVPWVSDSLKAKLYASFSRGGPWLEYLPLPTTDIHSEGLHSSKDFSRGIPMLVISATLLVGVGSLFWYRYWMGP